MKISCNISKSKNLIDLVSIRQKKIIKICFCKYCLQSFSSERNLIKHKDNCMKIVNKV